MRASEAIDTIPSELSTRLAFVGLDAAELAGLGRISHLISRHIPAALDGFYHRLLQAPEVAGFFDGAPQVERAKGRQSQHWQAIAEGRLDAAYLESANAVGLRHARIGLEPRWYIGGYALILETLIAGVVADYAAEQRGKARRGLFGSKPEELDVGALAGALAAMVKAVMVDIDLAVSAYFVKLTEDAAERDRLAKAKIERTVALTAEALQHLAEGDLASRIAAPFEPEFQQIKDDTNGLSERLEQLVGQLRGTSRALKGATGEILAGANDLADRTTRQAATIEETSAAMEQLMLTVGDNARRADLASDKAGAATALAAEGGGAMHRATEAMQRIASSSEKIGDIIGLIDDIAFQTNLLALNASVEAARAGEAGKGFAVVAVEVRRLAQSAAEASRDIKQLIDQSETEVQGGARLVDEAAEKLARIVGAVEENSALMREIADATGGQTAAIEEITVAVRQMDEMTQHNAALVEQTNAAIEQTEAQASALDMLVDVFSISEDARAEARPRRRA